jgi:hypothetical protein
MSKRNGHASSFCGRVQKQNKKKTSSRKQMNVPFVSKRHLCSGGELNINPDGRDIACAASSTSIWNSGC